MVMAQLAKRANSLFWLPLGVLAGGIIGAGVFSLPYMFSRSGLLVGFFYLAVAAAVYSVIHLLYADLMLRTPGEHRFVGYANLYLGRPFFYLGIVMAIIQMLFVLTIYLILSVRFTDLAVPGGSEMAKLLIFWLLGSFAIFMKLKRLALSEALVTVGIVAIILIIFGVGVVHLPSLKDLPLIASGASLLLPLPAILFALSGRVAIPAVLSYVKLKHGEARAAHKITKRIIIWGTLLPAIVYGLFVLGTLGITPSPTDDAVTGLVGLAPVFLVLLVGLLGWLSLWSSYILVGLDVSRTLQHDLKISHFWRVTLVVFGPIVFYLAGFNNFITLISFVGGILLSIEGILIVAMWVMANHRNSVPPILLKRKHGLLMVFLVVVFILSLMGVFIAH